MAGADCADSASANPGPGELQTPPPASGVPVTLQVHDISHGLAKELSAAFLGKTIDGIWHTAVAVFGTEYYFGAGIQRSSPVGSSPYGAAPQRVVELGRTAVPQARLEAFLEEEGTRARYTADSYNLLEHNCNHFSQEVAAFLGVSPLPHNILDLPRVVDSSSHRDLIMPLILYIEATLKKGGVPHLPTDMSPTALATLLQPTPPPRPAAAATTTTTTAAESGSEEAKATPAISNGHASPDDIDIHALQLGAPDQLKDTQPRGTSVNLGTGEIAARAASHRYIRNKAEFATISKTVLTNISNQP